jgi:hypothetical protein
LQFFSSSLAFNLYVNDEPLVVIIVESKYALDDLPRLASAIAAFAREVHGLDPYCVMVCEPWSMFRKWDGTINSEQTRKAFDVGRLNPLHVLMMQRSSVRNLPAAQIEEENIGMDTIYFFFPSSLYDCPYSLGHCWGFFFFWFQVFGCWEM